MGLTAFNQRRAREAEKAKAVVNTAPAIEVEEVKPVENLEPIEIEEVVEVEEVKPKKTDAEKLKKKTKQQ